MTKTLLTEEWNCSAPSSAHGSTHRRLMGWSETQRTATTEAWIFVVLLLVCDLDHTLPQPESTALGPSNV